MNNQENYLTNMNQNELEKYGMCKTLLCRRETIYLKHLMKNIFIYEREDELESYVIEYLGFKSLFQYMQYLTNKIRGIYKIPRSYEYNCDKIVKTKRESFFKQLDLYKQLEPIVILDFDKTITNKNFHSIFHFLVENNFKILINSANPDKDIIIKYLTKHGLMINPDNIYSNKGKCKKIKKLKDICFSNTNKTIFYIDDEEFYLYCGMFLGCYCYKYIKNKIYNYTVFKK